MNYFSLKLYLLLAGMLTVAAAGGWCAAKGMHPQSVLLFLIALITIIAIISLIRKLKTLVSTLLFAVEAADISVSFKAKGDRELGKMAEAMQRISSLYASAVRHLETNKFYYDRILKVMTHEIRNDLSPIISLAKDFSENPDVFSPEEIKESFELIYSQGADLKRFLDAYYELTHIPEPALRTVNIHNFLSGLNAKLDVYAHEKGLPPGSLKFISPQNLEADFDPALIGRALSNLIRNAIESVADCEKPQVTVTASVSDQKPFFTISDNGGGFSEEAASNLFMPFFSTKQGGSGIGLSLSRQIARLHKGDLTLSSNQNKGASFILTLG